MKFSKTNSLEVKVPASFLRDMLTSLPSKRFDAVALEFSGKGVRIRSYSRQATEYVHMEGTHSEMEVAKPGYLVVQVEDFLTVLRKFSASARVSIKWPQGDKITVSDEANERLFVEMAATDPDHLPDIPEDDKVYPLREGRVYFPLFVNGKWDGKTLEPCQTMATVPVRELEKGLLDMKIAGADYVIYGLSEGGSTTSSGRFSTRKGNSSSTPIDAHVSGPDSEVITPGAISEFLRGFDDNAVLQTDKRYSMFFLVRNQHTDASEVSTVFGLMQFTQEGAA